MSVSPVNGGRKGRPEGTQNNGWVRCNHERYRRSKPAESSVKNPPLWNSKVPYHRITRLRTWLNQPLCISIPPIHEFKNQEYIHNKSDRRSQDREAYIGNPGFGLFPNVSFLSVPRRHSARTHERTSGNPRHLFFFFSFSIPKETVRKEPR